MENILRKFEKYTVIALLSLNRPVLKISRRKPKLFQIKDFMYDTELASTDGKFEYSQINLKTQVISGFT